MRSLNEAPAGDGVTLGAGSLGAPMLGGVRGDIDSIAAAQAASSTPSSDARPPTMKRRLVSIGPHATGATATIRDP